MSCSIWYSSKKLNWVSIRSTLFYLQFFSEMSDSGQDLLVLGWMT